MVGRAAWRGVRPVLRSGGCGTRTPGPQRRSRRGWRSRRRTPERPACRQARRRRSGPAALPIHARTFATPRVARSRPNRRRSGTAGRRWRRTRPCRPRNGAPAARREARPRCAIAASRHAEPRPCLRTRPPWFSTRTNPALRGLQVGAKLGLCLARAALRRRDGVGERRGGLLAGPRFDGGQQVRAQPGALHGRDASPRPRRVFGVPNVGNGAGGSHDGNGAVAVADREQPVRQVPQFRVNQHASQVVAVAVPPDPILRCRRRRLSHCFVDAGDTLFRRALRLRRTRELRSVGKIGNPPTSGSPDSWD